MEHRSGRSSSPDSGVARLAAALLLSGVLSGMSLCWAEPDSLNVHLVGNWPFGPAKVAAFDAVRRVIFSGSGGGVFILDATNPASLAKVSERIHTPGLVRGLDYDPVTRRLYIADGPRGLEVWSVSTLTDPKFLGRCAVPGRALWVRTSGSLAYVACADSGLTVVDATDPSSPHVAGRLRTPGTALRLCVQGNYAYVADWTGGMLVVDVSDPVAPRVTGQFLGGRQTYQLCVRDTLAYIYDMTRGLSILSIADPGLPRELGNRHPGAWRHVRFLEAADTRLYEGAYTGVQGRFNIWDVSDPAQMEELGGRWFYDDAPEHGLVCDSTVYLLMPHDIVALDVSDPTTPRELATCNLPGAGRGLASSGSFVYIPDRGLRVLSISDPALPREVGFEPYSLGTRYVCAASGFCYVAASYMYVFDVRNPAVPKRSGMYVPTGLNAWVEGIHLEDSLAYLVGGEWGDSVPYWINGRLYAVNVRNPSTPREVWATTLPHRLANVAFMDTLVFCGSTVVSVIYRMKLTGSNSAYLGEIPTPGPPVDLCVHGRFLYAACENAGLCVYDSSGSGGAASWSAPGPVHGVAASGSRAYVAADTAGLRVLDMSDPMHPIEVGHYRTPGVARRVYASGPYIFVLDDSAGVQIYGLDEVGIEEVEPDRPAPSPMLARPLVRGTLEVLLSGSGPVQLMLYDVQGRRVLDATAAAVAGSGRVSMDVRALPTGVYFLRVSASNCRAVQRVTILK